MGTVEYVPGVIEADGSLSLSRIPRGHSYEYCVRTTIANTNKAIPSERCKGIGLGQFTAWENARGLTGNLDLFWSGQTQPQLSSFGRCGPNSGLSPNVLTSCLSLLIMFHNVDDGETNWVA